MSIIIKNLHKAFGDKIIINDLTYTFPDTGIVIINGKSGIGKTTLLRLISRLDNDYSGLIEFDKEKDVSYAFQEHRLFPHLNVLNNLLSVSFNRYGENDRKRAIDLLMKLGFAENDLKLFPDELSGGMKGRLSFARAVLYDKPILLLDEPTKELDDASKQAIFEIINSLSKTKLIIIVTHDTDLSLLNTHTFLTLQ